MYEKTLSKIRKNLAFSAESSGHQLDKTLRAIALDNCAVNMTFMVEYGVPCVRWMYSYLIFKEIL